MLEKAVGFAERVCLKLYRIVKRAYLRVRFGGRVHIGGVGFRRPFYCRVGPQGKIRVGGGTFMNYGVKVIAHESISIGSFCLIAPNVGIYDFDHRHELNGTRFGAQGMETDPVVIGDNVWIGANAVILKGAHIGSNTVIGAGAVVSGSIPSNSLVFDRKETVVRMRETSAPLSSGEVWAKAL